MKRFFFLLLFSILLSSSVSALGLISPRLDVFTYQPGERVEIPMAVRNFNHDVEITLLGPLNSIGSVTPLVDEPDGTKLSRCTY